MDSLKPLKLEKWETHSIKIHWSDGHISQYRSGWLRARCPCASCQEEANKPVAQPTDLNLLPVFDPSSEQLASLKPTGQYAYRPPWWPRPLTARLTARSTIRKLGRRFSRRYRHSTRRSHKSSRP